MNINGIELGELDVFDPDTMEKCENAFDKVVQEVQKIGNTKDIKASQAIRKQCIAVFNCFNEIFGDSTDKKVFGNKTNLVVCLKAFEELVEKVNEQKEELDSFINKYSPNRATRRHKK